MKRAEILGLISKEDEWEFSQCELFTDLDERWITISGYNGSKFLVIRKEIFFRDPV